MFFSSASQDKSTNGTSDDPTCVLHDISVPKVPVTPSFNTAATNKADSTMDVASGQSVVSTDGHISTTVATSNQSVVSTNSHISTTVATSNQSVVSTNNHTSTMAISEQTPTATSPEISSSTITYIAAGAGGGLLLLMLLGAAIGRKCRRKKTLIPKDAKQQPPSSDKKSASSLFANNYGASRRVSELVPLSMSTTFLASAEIPSVTASNSTVIFSDSITELTTSNNGHNPVEEYQGVRSANTPIVEVDARQGKGGEVSRVPSKDVIQFFDSQATL